MFLYQDEKARNFFFLTKQIEEINKRKEKETGKKELGKYRGNSSRFFKT